MIEMIFILYNIYFITKLHVLELTLKKPLSMYSGCISLLSGVLFFMATCFILCICQR